MTDIVHGGNGERWNKETSTDNEEHTSHKELERDTEVDGKEGEEPALCHDQDIHKHPELISSPNNHPPSSDSSKSAESSSSTTDLPLVTSPLSPRSSTTTE